MKRQESPEKNSGDGKCPLLGEETTAMLLDFAMGRLDRARAEGVSRHAANCEACVDFIAGQATVWSALDEWELGPVSSAFNQRFWRRVAEVDRIPWYLAFTGALRVGGWKRAIPVVAAVLVIAVGFLMDHRNGIPAARSGSGNSASVIEVDQMEKSLDDLQLLKQFDTTVTDAAASTRM